MLLSFGSGALFITSGSASVISFGLPEFVSTLLTSTHARTMIFSAGTGLISLACAFGRSCLLRFITLRSSEF